MSAENVAVGLWRAQARTKRSEEDQGWESNDRVVHGIDDAATIDLEGETRVIRHVCGQA